MNKIKNVIIATLIGALSIGATGCSMIEKTPEAKAKQVVAKVGNESITRGDVEKRLTSTITQLKTQYGDTYEKNTEVAAQLKEAKESALTSLVQGKLLVQYVAENKIEVDEDKITKAIDAVIESEKSQNSITTDADYVKFLATKGYSSIDEYKKTDLRDYQISTLAYEDINKNAKIPAVDVEKYLTDNPTFLKINEGKKFIQYILIMDKTPTGKALADKVRDEISKGASFEEYAAKYSDDSSSKYDGGYYGPIDKSTQLVETFLNAALALKEGELAPVVDDTKDYGYFVVKAITPKEGVKYQLMREARKTVVSDTFKKLETDKVTKYTDKLNN